MSLTAAKCTGIHQEEDSSLIVTGVWTLSAFVKLVI